LTWEWILSTGLGCLFVCTVNACKTDPSMNVPLAVRECAYWHTDMHTHVRPYLTWSIERQTFYANMTYIWSIERQAF
jgi:hypothetical protein